MPLTRLKDEYLEQNGVRFLMEDQDGNTVACRVSHEALRDHADRVHFSESDGAVFQAYRESRLRVTLTTPKALSTIMAEFSSPPRRSRGWHAAPKPNPNDWCSVRRGAPQKKQAQK